MRDRVIGGSRLVFAVTALESDLLSSLNLGSTAVFGLGSFGVMVSSVNTVQEVLIKRLSKREYKRLISER